MKGITAYLKLENDENIELVLNDVISTSETDNTDWTHSTLFTSNSYSENSLKELSLSKEQFAEIGENLIIRLLAVNGLLK
jgi:hypothetical protein